MSKIIKRAVHKMATKLLCIGRLLHNGECVKSFTNIVSYLRLPKIFMRSGVRLSERETKAQRNKRICLCAQARCSTKL
jgi:hypothetical protein